LEEHLREGESMSQAMDRTGLEDVSVATDDRTPTEVAQEVLERVGWID
jgi:hypothetical protein